MIENRSWHTINQLKKVLNKELYNSNKALHRFNNILLLTFNLVIILMSMWTNKVMVFENIYSICDIHHLSLFEHISFLKRTGGQLEFKIGEKYLKCWIWKAKKKPE